MKYCTITTFVSVCIILGGCSGGGQGKSEFATPQQSGIFSGFDEVFREDIFSDGGGNGWAYAIGGVPNKGFFGKAGILPNTNLGAGPTSSTIRYSGVFGLAMMEEIRETDENYTGSSFEDTGPMELTISFDSGSFEGSGSGFEGELTVSGKVDIFEDTLSGSAQYDGMKADLTGIVGFTDAIGVFHGSQKDRILVGGFGVVEE